MALIAGAGNPTGGSNPTGTGNLLNYIGDHVIGYNNIDVTDSEVTILKFTTGPHYIVGTVQINGLDGSSQNFKYLVKFNGEIYNGYITTDQTQYTSPDNPIEILIPAFTKVEITGENIEGSNTSQTAATIIGRVYA